MQLFITDYRRMDDSHMQLRYALIGEGDGHIEWMEGDVVLYGGTPSDLAAQRFYLNSSRRQIVSLVESHIRTYPVARHIEAAEGDDPVALKVEALTSVRMKSLNIKAIPLNHKSLFLK